MCVEKICRAVGSNSRPSGRRTKLMKSEEAKNEMKSVDYSAGNSHSYSRDSSNPICFSPDESSYLSVSHGTVKNLFRRTKTSSTLSETVETPNKFSSVMDYNAGYGSLLFKRFSNLLFVAFTLVILNGRYFLRMLKDRLDKQPSLIHGKEMSCDYTPSSVNVAESESLFVQQLEEDTVFMDQYNSLVHVFKTVLDSAKAKELAQTILTTYNDASISTLQHCYYNNSRAFMQETLPELGVSSVLDRQNISCAISKLRPPPTLTNCMIACIDEHEYIREQKVIRHTMSFSNYFTHFVDMNGNWQYDVYRHYEMDANNSTLLHFGTRSETLEEDSIGDIFNEKRVQYQTRCCVINSCESEEVVRKVKSALSNECVIYWETKVDEDAAIRFSKEFYGILSANESNSLAFRYAFEMAKKLMESHNFVFTDITADNKRIYSGSKTVAGILKFWSREDATIISSHGNKRKKIDTNADCREISDEQDVSLVTRNEVRQDWRNNVAIASLPSGSITSTVSETSQVEAQYPNKFLRSNVCDRVSILSSTSDSSEPPTELQSSTEHFIGLKNIENKDTSRVYNTSKPTYQYCAKSAVAATMAISQSWNDLQMLNDNQESMDIDITKIIPSQNYYRRFDTHVSKKRRREGDKEIPQKSENGRALQNYHSKKCQLQINYVFSCNHTTVSNCQFIKYKNKHERKGREDKSLETDIIECKEREKCKTNLSKCKNCGIYYCNGKKVPSKSSIVDKSCFDVHVCNSEPKDKADISIKIEDRHCIECLKCPNDFDFDSAMSWSEVEKINLINY